MMYPVCDIEGSLEIFPYAVLCLVHLVFSALVTGIKQLPELPCKGMHWAIVVYVCGLMVLERKQTQRKIAEEIGHISHDALNRLGFRLLPHPQMMVAFTLGLIGLLGGEGYLILDDFFIPKPFSNRIIGAYYQFDPTERRELVGQRVVLVLWTNGVVRVPVAFTLWHKREYVSRYRTKNQLARLLIYWVKRRGIPFAYLTFDNWYASKQNLRYFRTLGIEVVTRLKKNTWLKWEGEKLKAQALAKRHPIGSYHYYPALNAYVKSFVLQYPGYGTIRLAVVKHDRHDEPGQTKFLAASCLERTNRELVARYRSRWAIEVWIRDAKQHLGLSACQARERHQVLTHLRMVFLAGILSDLLKGQTDATLGELHTHLRSLLLVKVGQHPPCFAKLSPSGKIEKIPVETLLNPVWTSLRLPAPPQTPWKHLMQTMAA